MKRHTPLGKILYWVGFLIFMIGFFFNANIGLLAPTTLEKVDPFSFPLMIFAIMIIMVANTMKKKKD